MSSFWIVPLVLEEAERVPGFPPSFCFASSTNSCNFFKSPFEAAIRKGGKLSRYAITTFPVLSSFCGFCFISDDSSFDPVLDAFSFSFGSKSRTLVVVLDAAEDSVILSSSIICKTSSIFAPHAFFSSSVGIQEANGLKASDAVVVRSSLSNAIVSLLLLLSVLPPFSSSTGRRRRFLEDRWYNSRSRRSCCRRWIFWASFPGFHGVWTSFR